MMGVKDILAEIKQKAADLLAAQVEKGYSPVLVVTPDQESKTKTCRMCGQADSQFGFVIVGRELPALRVYIYCIPMVCRKCHGNEVKATSFLNRLQAYYEKKQ